MVWTCGEGIVDTLGKRLLNRNCQVGDKDEDHREDS